MEEFFKNICEEYENEKKKIIKNNIFEYNDVKLSHIHIKPYETTIPFIEPLPKTQFYIFTPVNIYIKDEPILRYKPFVKTNQKKIFMYFYNDTTVFDSPYNEKTELLIRLLQKIHLDKMFNFYDIKNFFHIKHEDLLKFNKRYKYQIETNPKPLYQNYYDFFCSLCLIFGCKIHELQKDLRFYEDTDECYCSLIIKSSILQNNAKTIKNEEIINEYLKSYNGDTCMVSYMLLQNYNFYISCTTLKNEFNKIINKKTKTIKNLRRLLKTNYFFDLCNHTNKCNDNILCKCYRNRTGCSLKCLCTCCDFNKFVRDSKDKFLEKKTYCARSNIAGTGCFAGEKIKKNEFIIEYTGEYISKSEADRRANFYDLNKMSYLFDLSFANKKSSVDAMFLGNNSRFINHSKNANVVSEIIEKDFVSHIYIFAIKNIDINEELFMDYKYDEEIENNFGFK